MNRKNIFLWALYDFSNSIVAVVFFLYFSQWLVVDMGVSDTWYNMLFIFATILLIFTAPIVSILADKSGKSFQFLRISTVIVWVLFILLSLVTILSPERVVLSMILFVVGNFAYQSAFNFYNPLLNEIATPSKRGIVSGIGNASNWIGQIVGLLIALPFANGSIYFFGEPGRAQVFLPVSIIFILLSLPMLIAFKKKPGLHNAELSLSHIKKEYRNVFKEAKMLFLIPGVSMFMLAFFFFNDAILTASNNFPIVLERVFSSPDSEKTLLMVLILITSAIGSIICGYLGDRYGLKRVLIWILAGWIVIFPLISLSQTISLLTILVTIMGLLFGGVWAVSRALLSRLIPAHKLNYGFSFYTISERFASFLGPLVWSGILAFTPTENNLNYRIAMVSMTVFIIIGIILMRKVEYSEARHS